MIYVIDDDEIMGECVARACTGHEVRQFTNAIEAMNFLAEAGPPDLIFLDILLDGPDGFTFLNELQSYADTAVVPVVIVSSLDFAGRDLRSYGVVEALHKDTMRPEQIRVLAEKYDQSEPKNAR